MGVRNPIGLFTHAINYELLVKHQKAAATKVKHSVKEKKVSGMGKKEEQGMVKENAAAGREIGEGERAVLTRQEEGVLTGTCAEFGFVFSVSG